MPDENAHAPDERLDLGNFHTASSRRRISIRRLWVWIRQRCDRAVACRCDFATLVGAIP
jgi:hypothetical protein